MVCGTPPSRRGFAQTDMSLTLAPQQDKAMGLIKRWYADQSTKPFFILNGFAGTGKTTLAKLFPETLGVNVVYAAYTGKAALQLRKRGCVNATTLHKLLYSPVERDRTRLQELAQQLEAALVTDPLAEGQEARQLRDAVLAERRRVSKPTWERKEPRLPEKTELLVVDESSMVDQRVFDDILAIGLKTVFLGDPFQLPPVFGSSPVDSFDADVTLTDVHRQALDSAVLRAATQLRSDGRLIPTTRDADGGAFIVKKKDESGYEDYASADQVLCGRNNTRRTINKRMRRRLVESGNIERSELALAAGDKVVFLRNDHEDSVFNGTVAKLTSVVAGELASDELIVGGEADEHEIHGYPVWPGLLDERDMVEAPRRAQVVDLAYALTVHKAQGSEWDKVLIHDEAFGGAYDGQRWLYTAVTRARKSCTIVM